MNDVDRKIRTWQKMGWCPVRYAHLPKPIKDSIREIGFRPQMKQCYANCQRFVIHTNLEGVEYHEGWVMSIIPIEHAWLTWNGQVIDLTLEPDGKHEYLDSTAYTREEIIRSLWHTGCFGPVDHFKLAELSPYRKFLKEQEAKANGKGC